MGKLHASILMRIPGSLSHGLRNAPPACYDSIRPPPDWQSRRSLRGQPHHKAVLQGRDLRIYHMTVREIDVCAREIAHAKIKEILRPHFELGCHKRQLAQISRVSRAAMPSMINQLWPRSFRDRFQRGCAMRNLKLCSTLRRQAHRGVILHLA